MDLFSGPPNTTLYVQNLNERVPLEHLKKTLWEIFGEHGQVMDIIAKGRMALRGQAFILFHDVETATRALGSLQGGRIYGRSMNIRFARYKSDWLSQQDGTFEIERNRREQDRQERARLPKMTRRQLLAQLAANPAATIPFGMMPSFPGMTTFAPGMMQSAPPSAGSNDALHKLLPNNILYLSSLPAGATEVRLNNIFREFSGYVEVRMVPARSDIAFIDFETEDQAAVARQATDGMEIGSNSDEKLRVSFARR